MIVKLVYQGKVFALADFDLVLVEQNDETPVAFAAKCGPEGTYTVSSVDAGQARFNEALRRAGLDRTVIITDLSKSLKHPESLSRVV